MFIRIKLHIVFNIIHNSIVVNQSLKVNIRQKYAQYNLFFESYNLEYQQLLCQYTMCLAAF